METNSAKPRSDIDHIEGLNKLSCLFVMKVPLAVGFFQLLQIRFQLLRHLDFGYIEGRKETAWARNKTRSSTCRGLFRSGFFRLDRKGKLDITQGIGFKTG